MAEFTAVLVHAGLPGLQHLHCQAGSSVTVQQYELTAGLLLSAQYLAAFGNIAKAGNTMLLPSSASDPATMVAQALSIYNSVSAKAPLLDGGCAAAETYLKLTRPRMQGVVL